MTERRRLPWAVEWAQRILGDRIRPGAWVVDATAGNGHDTLFLAKLVGAQGCVYAFDIQPGALEATRRLLAQTQVEEGRCRLLLHSHAQMEEKLPPEAVGRIDGVMFNLGFCPGADKRLTTRTHSTIEGLCAASRVLARGGILSVIAYPGHETGREEAEHVGRWMGALAPEAFEVQTLRAVNRVQSAPELWLALRL
jgi:hypothetical protein